jgi:hypothetical protein
MSLGYLRMGLFGIPRNTEFCAEVTLRPRNFPLFDSAEFHLIPRYSVFFRIWNSVYGISVVKILEETLNFFRIKN